MGTGFFDLVCSVTMNTAGLRTGLAEAESRIKQTIARTESAVTTMAHQKKLSTDSGARAAAYEARLKSLKTTHNATLREMRAQTKATITELHTLVTGLETKVATTSGARLDSLNHKIRMLNDAIADADRRLKLQVQKENASYKYQQTSLQRRLSSVQYAQQLQADRAENTGESIVANDAVLRAQAARIDLQARQRSATALSMVGSTMMRASAAGLVGVVGAAVPGMQWNQQFVQEMGNTSLAFDQYAGVKSDIQALGVESGAKFSELAEGFRKIENFGYSASDSLKILRESMKAARASGGDLAATSELLAGTMKNFNVPVRDAGKMMAYMYGAANRASLELSDFVKVGGRVFAMAKQMGATFSDASAALAVFTRHQFNATQAATQFNMFLMRMAHPTKAVKEKLKYYSDATGVDLLSDFTPGGVRAKGVSGVLLDVQAAAAKMGGKHPEDLATELFPNLRGTLGAGILGTPSGLKEFMAEIKAIQTTGAEEAKRINDRYKLMLEQTQTSVDRIRNTFVAMSGDLATVLEPTVKRLADLFKGIATRWSGMSDTSKSLIVNVGLWGIALTGVLGVVSKIAAGLVGIRALIATLGIGGTSGATKASVAAALGGGLFASLGVAGPAGLIATALGAIGYAGASISMAYDERTQNTLAERPAEVNAMLRRYTDRLKMLSNTLATLKKNTPKYTQTKAKINELRAIIDNYAGNGRSATSTGKQLFPSAKKTIEPNPFAIPDAEHKARARAQARKLSPYEQQLKQFGSEEASLTAELNALYNTEDTTLGSVAKKYDLLDSARQKHLATLRDEIKAYTEQLKAREAWTAFVTEQSNRIAVAGATDEARFARQYSKGAGSTQALFYSWAIKQRADQLEQQAKDDADLQTKLRRYQRDAQNIMLRAYKNDPYTLEANRQWGSEENFVDYKSLSAERKATVDAVVEANRAAANYKSTIDELTHSFDELGVSVASTLVSVGSQAMRERQEAADKFAESLIPSFEAMGDSIASTAQTIMDNADKMRNKLRTIAREVNGFFMNMFTNLREYGFKAFFTDILASFSNMLYEMAARWISSQLTQMVMGLVQGGLSGLFGISGAGKTMAYGTYGSGFGGGSYGGLASGGAVAAGRSYIVGERGPEVFTSKTDGRITPNHELGGVVQNITIVTPDANSFHKSQTQVTQDLHRAAMRSARRR